MCDYSLEGNFSRPAKVGDRLVSSHLPGTITKGFIEVGGDVGVAVCLLPGTELAFDEEIRLEGVFSWFNRKVGQQTAVFREINLNNPQMHHDALEFPDGKQHLITALTPGQICTVLQLPVNAESKKVLKKPVYEMTPEVVIG